MLSPFPGLPILVTDLHQFNKVMKNAGFKGP